MKKISATILILFFAFNTFSQESTDGGFIGISMGPGFPSGDFGDDNAEHEHAQYATTGFVFDINFAKRLGKNLGIAVMLRGQSNPVNVSNVVADLNLSLPGSSWTLQSDPWVIGLFMVGGYATFPNPTGTNAIELKALIGSISVTYPHQTLTSTYNGNSFFAENQKNSASGFAVLFGANYRFNVAKKISFLLSADIFTGDVEFETLYVAPSGAIKSYTYDQNITSINLGFGVAYRLGAN